MKIQHPVLGQRNKGHEESHHNAQIRLNPVLTRIALEPGSLIYRIQRTHTSCNQRPQLLEAEKSLTLARGT